MEIVLVILFFAAIGVAVFFAVKANKTAALLNEASNAAARLQQQIAVVQQQSSAALQEAANTSAGLRRQLTITQQQSAAALDEAARVSTGLRQQVAGLQQQVERLARYQAIVDVEAVTADLRGRTEAWAAEVRARTEAAAAQVRAHAEAEATRIAAEARREADRLVAEAQARRAEAIAAAEATTSRASAEANRIVEQANRKAEETAGAALTAVRDAKRLEQVAQAMKNVIEGYGDRYVMPTVGLLDELAEEVGFAEAGQRLKAAREKTRALIKQQQAATCDYVEANRRTTAIEFVLDAFNGKVDTILADVKDDNFGTLERKIRDAFTLVNHNGRAFRDARILDVYLEARLDELRWAVIATALKQKEREEQRLIKERIREEERAQREYEKAMKEAEKEQETLRKAMEKARRDVEKSTDAERARYEEKLRELSERLRVAEEKNQRALSMAQQTKSGNVYIISNIGSFGEEVFKIGMTRRMEPLDRVRELGDASVPFEFDVHAMIPSQDAPALEHALHRRFVRSQVNKVNPRKEFFRIPLSEIRAEIEKLGIDVAWTLTAAARDFRETQAIEQALANKTLDEAKWLEKQKDEVPLFDEQEVAEPTA